MNTQLEIPSTKIKQRNQNQTRNKDQQIGKNLDKLSIRFYELNPT